MKTFLKSTVLAASLLGALSSASAETLRVRIPFGFSAAGTAMPAGPYTISTMQNAASVLVFENEETKAQTIVFARTALGPAAKPNVPLMFTAEGAELANIATADRTYELNLHSTRKSLKGVALTLTPGK